MAEILNQLKSDMKEAMKAKEAERLSTIRMLISALNNEKISAQRDLTDEDAITVLSREAKKRRDAAAQYRDGDRIELAEKEERELVTVEAYLPAQLSDAEVEAIVAEVIASTGAASKADMGKVMGPVMAKVKGQCDGKRVKDIVMSKLA